jgi:hypothetical protein
LIYRNQFPSVGRRLGATETNFRISARPSKPDIKLFPRPKGLVN